MIWSCLQGVMGDLYTDDSGDSAASSKASSKISGPETAKAVLGDFIFLAGKPSEELLLHQPPCRAAKKAEFQILVPKDAGWERLIEKVYGSRAEKITRYGIKKEPDAWDGEGRERLQEMAAALPEGYELRLIDQKLYDQCRQQEWSRDLVSQFPNYESYRQWGLGAAVLHGTELVCGASSYSRYREGIEIEIDTKPEHRRRGLARACAARLILECLDRGLYPSYIRRACGKAGLSQRRRIYGVSCAAVWIKKAYFLIKGENDADYDKKKQAPIDFGWFHDFICLRLRAEKGGTA